MTSGTEARTIAFCQELVRLESLSGEEQAVAEAVEREMRSLGFDEVRRDELGSVVGVIHGARAAGTDAAPGAGLDRGVFYAPYSANATASAGHLGFPTLLYGAGDISAAHAVDESVGVGELLAAFRGYQALARGLVA